MSASPFELLTTVSRGPDKLRCRARTSGGRTPAGFAVIDLETTGFAFNANDRVCEIGVVLVAP